MAEGNLYRAWYTGVDRRCEEVYHRTGQVQLGLLDRTLWYWRHVWRYQVYDVICLGVRQLAKGFVFGLGIGLGISLVIISWVVFG